MKRLIVARHADYIPKSSGDELTPRGRQKAIELADRIQQELGPDSKPTILCSEAARARQSAYPISERYGLVLSTFTELYVDSTCGAIVYAEDSIVV
jgi:phosphohistidine phosphatase SixA